MSGSNVIIDLSHHNENVDLGRARADGILGIIHKCTQGSGFVDPTFAARRKAAAAAGILWGAYHFGTSADPVAQARFFLNVAKPTLEDLVVLDFELNESKPSNTMTLDQVRAFISTVQDVTGIAPGLYGGALLKKQLGENIDPVLQACWLWWAQYSPEPRIPPNWSAWTLWQYTNGHHGHAPFKVDGVGACDRDQYPDTAETLRARWLTGSLAPGSSNSS
jgi:lysozyme